MDDLLKQQQTAAPITDYPRQPCPYESAVIRRTRESIAELRARFVEA